jgi:hypothetical protein
VNERTYISPIAVVEMSWFAVRSCVREIPQALEHTAESARSEQRVLGSRFCCGSCTLLQLIVNVATSAQHQAKIDRKRTFSILFAITSQLSVLKILASEEA